MGGTITIRDADRNVLTSMGNGMKVRKNIVRDGEV